MNRFIKILLFFGLFLGSFVFFLFLTFPYEVLKESIATELSQQTGYNVRIGDMSPAFPLGVRADSVRIDAPGGAASLSLASLKLKINPLAIFLGRIKATAVISSGAGELEASAVFPIVSAAQGELIPSRLLVDAQAFPLDQIVHFALSSAASSPGANPLVTPLLSAIGFSGNLDSQIDLNLNTREPAQSTGSAEINLRQAVLKLSDPALGLSDQVFSKAVIKARVEGGSVVLDKASRLASDEIEIVPEGKIKIVTKPTPLASQLDLKVAIKLNKGLNEKFGFLIGMFTGKESADGQMTMQVRGPMEAPSTTTF